jgi:hypothetical protein
MEKNKGRMRWGVSVQVGRQIATQGESKVLMKVKESIKEVDEVEEVDEKEYKPCVQPWSYISLQTARPNPVSELSWR